MMLSQINVKNGKQYGQFIVTFCTDDSISHDEIFKHIFWHDLDSARAKIKKQISETSENYMVDYLNTVLTIYNRIEKYNLMPSCK